MKFIANEKFNFIAFASDDFPDELLEALKDGVDTLKSKGVKKIPMERAIEIAFDDDNWPWSKVGDPDDDSTWTLHLSDPDTQSIVTQELPTSGDAVVKETAKKFAAFSTKYPAVTFIALEVASNVDEEEQSDEPDERVVEEEESAILIVQSSSPAKRIFSGVHRFGNFITDPVVGGTLPASCRSGTPFTANMDIFLTQNDQDNGNAFMTCEVSSVRYVNGVSQVWYKMVPACTFVRWGVEDDDDLSDEPYRPSDAAFRIAKNSGLLLAWSNS